jgi:hypothetical protein
LKEGFETNAAGFPYADTPCANVRKMALGTSANLT